jgi:UDP-N-acetylenolpyruvoylglucosamine reductase
MSTQLAARRSVGSSSRSTTSLLSSTSLRTLRRSNPRRYSTVSLSSDLLTLPHAKCSLSSIGSNPCYTDLHALAELLGRPPSIDAALSMDAGLRLGKIAEAFARVARLDDQRFLTVSHDPESIRRYSSTWAGALTND